MCLGIPGKLLEKSEQDSLPMGKVQFGGIAKEVCFEDEPEFKDEASGHWVACFFAGTL